jgi:hypothetical protein
MNQIFINGTNYTTDCIGLDELELEYSLDEGTGSFSVSTSSEIAFKNDAFDLLYDTYFADPKAGYTTIFRAKIVLDCCGGDELEFEIISDAVIYCPDDCTIKTNLREFEPESKCFDDIKSRVFWKTGLNTNIMNPAFFSRVKYCEPVDIWRLVVLYFWLLAKATPIIFIIDIFDEIFGSGDGFVNRVDDWTVGAGHFHVAFNAGKAIEFNAKRCNLTFESPALQGPFKNLYILSADNEEGIDQRFIDSNIKVLDLWEQNAPNQTTSQLLDTLKPVFDYEYRIINGKLRFDHIENIVEEFTYLFDIEEESAKGTIEPFCYSFVQLENYAYGRFNYRADTIDTQGNRMIRFYNDIVEWNKNPTNDFQKGELDNTIQFSPTIFMRDQRQSALEFTAFVNTQRESPLIGRRHEYEPIIKQGMTGLPKLLLMSNPASGTVQRTTKSNSPRVYRYQEDLHFQENGKATNLFNRYHKRRNPRTAGRKIEVDGIIMAFNCEIAQLINQHKLNTYIKTPYGKMTFESVTINYAQGKIEFKNLRV